MNKIDIFITSYLRPMYTLKTLEYLRERTEYPHRTFLIDQGGNITFKSMVDHYIALENMGIHAAWNIALSLAESEYFITSDNDIYVPDLDPAPDWLTQMVSYMDERPDYAAISLHPHVLIGAPSIDPLDPEDVVERNMCGAVMRIMRTDAVRRVGGWEHKIDPKRNHEERWICGKLQEEGFKVGIASRVRAYHPFGDNWGYPKEITPEMQGHNPALREEVVRFDNPDAYDPKTWLPKH